METAPTFLFPILSRSRANYEVSERIGSRLCLLPWNADEITSRFPSSKPGGRGPVLRPPDCDSAYSTQGRSTGRVPPKITIRRRLPCFLNGIARVPVACHPKSLSEGGNYTPRGLFWGSWVAPASSRCLMILHRLEAGATQEQESWITGLTRRSQPDRVEPRVEIRLDRVGGPLVNIEVHANRVGNILASGVE